MGSDDGSKSREDKIAEETEKVKTMKVGEMRKELQSMGISTRSFFEKSEFVKALVTARVDGVKKKSASTTGGPSSAAAEEEAYDPSYRDVQMRKFNRANSFDAFSGIIDVR